MIRKCDNGDIEKVLEYIDRDYGKCLYMYIDIKKYGMNTDFFTAWLCEDKDGKPEAVVSGYHTGMQIFSRDNEFDKESVSGLILNNTPTMVAGMKDTIDLIKAFFSGYSEECGSVGKLAEIKAVPAPGAYSSGDGEIREIVDLISKDDELGGPYRYEDLLSQFTERRKEGFGRNYILRNTDNALIGHAATYAELSDLAVISGVITAPEFRGKGYSEGILAALCEALIRESKDVFSYYYIEAAERMHKGVGFETIGEWSKLVKDEKD